MSCWVSHRPRTLQVQAQWNMTGAYGQSRKLEMSVCVGCINYVL